MAKARLSGGQQAGGAKNLDSLRRTLVRAYTDSAIREAAAAPSARVATRQAAADSAGARPTPNDSRAALSVPPRPPATPRLPSASRANAKAAPPAARPPIFSRPRRVAILPVRDATLKPEVAPAVRALQDSLRKTLVDAGYTPASDAELVQLMANPDLAAQRRIADTLGIGAIVMSILSTRGDEIVAQSIVLDVWRNYPMSDRTATDLDKPQEALGVVRNVSRALERVSWRARTDPKRVIVFDLDNQTGSDSVDTLARQLGDSLRAVIVKRLGAQIIGDSAARATKDVTERRAVGTHLGAGAIVAGTLYRARGDSVSLRLSTRDMSEDKSYPNVEVRAARRELIASFQSFADRLLADLGQVNWGPKAR
jgi:hypothetical protein